MVELPTKAFSLGLPCGTRVELSLGLPSSSRISKAPVGGITPAECAILWITLPETIPNVDERATMFARLVPGWFFEQASVFSLAWLAEEYGWRGPWPLGHRRIGGDWLLQVPDPGKFAQAMLVKCEMLITFGAPSIEEAADLVRRLLDLVHDSFEMTALAVTGGQKVFIFWERSHTLWAVGPLARLRSWLADLVGSEKLDLQKW